MNKIADVTTARSVLDADKQRRAEKALSEIMPILEKLGCELGAFVTIAEQDISVPVRIIAR